MISLIIEYGIGNTTSNVQFGIRWTAKQDLLMLLGWRSWEKTSNSFASKAAQKPSWLGFSFSLIFFPTRIHFFLCCCRSWLAARFRVRVRVRVRVIHTYGRLVASLVVKGDGRAIIPMWKTIRDNGYFCIIKSKLKKKKWQGKFPVSHTMNESVFHTSRSPLKLGKSNALKFI